MNNNIPLPHGVFSAPGAIFVAIAYNHIEAVQVLCEGGVDITELKTWKLNFSPFRDEFFHHPEKFNGKAPELLNAIELAEALEKTEILEYLQGLESQKRLE